ncbi:MAG: hypothetical protein AAGI38_09480 [Bacteroidota bacterium]
MSSFSTSLLRIFIGTFLLVSGSLAQTGTQSSPISRIISHSSEKWCQGCDQEFARGNFRLVIADGSPQLEMVGLQFLPNLLTKNKDQLLVRIWENAPNVCSPNSIPAAYPLTRKEIHSQLTAQHEVLLTMRLQQALLRAYKRGLFRIMPRLTEEEAENYLGQVNESLSETSATPQELLDAVTASWESTLEKRLAEASRKVRLQVADEATRKDFLRQEARIKKKRKRFKRFLKGKQRFSTGSQPIPWHLDFKLDGITSLQRFQIEVQKKGRSCLKANFDQVESFFPKELCAIDAGQCDTMDRMIYFFTHSKAQPPKGIPSYRPKPKRKQVKTFGLFFEKNKSVYDTTDLQPILAFLSDSSYIIRRARVQAYASVEGTEEINLRLQQERAEVLIRLLQERQRSDTIETEIITGENWPLFRKQLGSKGLSKTPYAAWKDMEEAKLRELLTDSLNLLSLEPFLAKQRKAVLKLAVEETLTPERKWEIVEEDFWRLRRMLRDGEPDKAQKAVQYLIGMQRYVRSAVRAGELNADAPIFDQVMDLRNDQLDLAGFYDFRRDQARGLSPVGLSEREIILRAYQASSRQIWEAFQQENAKNRKSSINNGLQVQLYAYNRMLKGELTDSLFCELFYPNRKPFWPLLMNRLYFERTKGNSLVSGSPCPIEWVATRGNTVADSKNDLYYNLLKSRVQDEEVQSKLFRAFDLVAFLTVSVDNWKADRPLLYDEEVTQTHMGAFLAELGKLRVPLCKKTLNQLSLDFHRKSSYYYASKDKLLPDGRLNHQPIESAEFIRDYYLDRPASSEENYLAAQHLVSLHAQYPDSRFLRWARDLLIAEQDLVGASEESRALFFLLDALDTRYPATVLRKAEQRMEGKAWCEFMARWGFVLGIYEEGLPDAELQVLRKKYCQSCK